MLLYVCQIYTFFWGCDLFGQESFSAADSDVNQEAVIFHTLHTTTQCLTC